MTSPIGAPKEPPDSPLDDAKMLAGEFSEGVRKIVTKLSSPETRVLVKGELEKINDILGPLLAQTRKSLTDCLGSILLTATFGKKADHEPPPPSDEIALIEPHEDR